MARMRKTLKISRQQGVITLRRLLLLFTGGLLSLVLIAAVSVSFDRFRDYMTDQLRGHAQDGATAIGLSLSNAIDGRDPVASSSLIDAVFDSGRYLSVVYLDNNGEEIVGREASLREIAVPGWFVALADLPLPAAEAEVVRGWSRLGKVRVVSHPGRAYEDLWKVTIRTAAGSVLVGGVGLIGLFWTITRLLRPLRAVETQARALGRRDFRRRVDITSTRELNQVTRAMNQMADDLGQLFEGQARLIQHLRKVNNEDSVTGLASRRAFEQRLKVEVESEERAAPGILFLIQLAEFSLYNQTFGREEADGLLVRIAGAIDAFTRQHGDAFAGRLTGAEFGIFLPGISRADGLIWCRELVAELDGIYSDLAAPMEVAVHAGIAQAAENRHVDDLMSAADEALRQAQSDESSACHAADTDRVEHHSSETWRAIIERAIRVEQLSLWLQPMVGSEGNDVLFHQVFSRMNTPDGLIKAAIFVPMAERFGMTPDIDRWVLGRALALLREQPETRLAMTLGMVSVASDDFRQELLEQLSATGPERQRLQIGVSEQAIHHHRIRVGLLVRALNRLQVPVIVDRFGVGGVPFSYLRNLRFQALRIDSSFIHDIDSHEDNRFYLESVTTMAHSRGVRVYVTGVETASESSALAGLGIDGAMGYHLGRPFEAGR
ncbi:EAL domain-containing protein [Marinobacter sp. HL-58]|uniref:bifunctional diguanylate cyclase/phosphodiesterase n=1 Tax=Marinobacter sp. HL-58 TaxID=1479237 RepID=UPI00047FFE3E|nr:EAL domain-containing protein [Marinobacter sp. HL-58]KPQ02975.1 MAG: diguanylate cyclase/phosphodiesterase [Marinobacter sp. HL-58]